METEQNEQPTVRGANPLPEPTVTPTPLPGGRADSLEDIMREYSHCGPDLQSVREVKTRADHRIRELMAQLEREKSARDQEFERRADKLRNDEKLKGDALKAQMARISDEKAAADRLFADRIQQALHEQSEQEHAFRERLLHIDQFERQRYDDLQMKVRHLQEDWQDREQEFLHRIEQLRHEMQEGRRLLQERIDQMLGDGQYKAEPDRQRQELQREWQSVEHRITGQLTLIQAEKAQQDHFYEQAMSRFRTDLQRMQAELADEIGQLEREKARHIRMIDDRIATALEEKRRQEELFELAQDKEKLEREYEARLGRAGGDKTQPPPQAGQ